MKFYKFSAERNVTFQKFPFLHAHKEFFLSRRVSFSRGKKEEKKKEKKETENYCNVFLSESTPSLKF